MNAVKSAYSDPYFAWVDATGYLGSPPVDATYIPMLVEFSQIQANEAKIKRSFQQLIKSKDLVLPPYFFPAPWPRRATFYIRKQKIKDFIGLLALADCRWELGLPFASPNGFVTAGEAGGEGQPKPGPVNVTTQGNHIVGFIDYGCAFANQKFRVWDSPDRCTLRSRVLALWDQGGDPVTNREAANAAGMLPPQWRPPVWRSPFNSNYGAELCRIASNPPDPAGQTGLPLDVYLQQFANGNQLDEEACYQYCGYQGIQTPIAHGTHMMDVAAGYPNPLHSLDAQPVAPTNEDIVFVQLPRYFSEQQVSGLLRTFVLDAVHYILSFAKDASTAVTINLSYGAYTGPHDGSSILEMALDDLIAQERSKGRTFDIVIAAGNGGDQQAHCETQLKRQTTFSTLWCNIPDNPTDQFTEVWLTGEDPQETDAAKLCRVRFTPPGMQPQEADWVNVGQQKDVLHNAERVGMVVAPWRVGQSPRGRMVLLAVAPTIHRVAEASYRPPAPYGEWLLEIHNPATNSVTVNAWIERDEPVFASGSGPRQARFTKKASTSKRTLNTIAHGSNTTVVGGYVGTSQRIPTYSAFGPGRGDSDFRNVTRPSGANGKRGPEDRKSVV